MNGDIDLITDERNNGRERLCVRWVGTDNGGHRLEIGVDRKDGEGWKRGFYVWIDPGEVFRIHDAVGQATWLARCVKR